MQETGVGTVLAPDADNPGGRRGQFIVGGRRNGNGFCASRRSARAGGNVICQLSPASWSLSLSLRARRSRELRTPFPYHTRTHTAEPRFGTSSSSPEATSRSAPAGDLPPGPAAGQIKASTPAYREPPDPHWPSRVPAAPLCCRCRDLGLHDAPAVAERASLVRGVGCAEVSARPLLVRRREGVHGRGLLAGAGQHQLPRQREGPLLPAQRLHPQIRSLAWLSSSGSITWQLTSLRCAESEKRLATRQHRPRPAAAGPANRPAAAPSAQGKGRPEAPGER
jgi:hypothetical protein